MKKLIASAAIATTLIGGSAAGLALAGTSAASADTTSGSAATTATAAVPKPPWADAIKGLVTKGTITQAQADAVSQAIEQSRPADGPHGHGHGPGLSVAASAIGIDESALRTALDSGQTIAQVATAHNVAVQKVIDALKADMASHLASDVSSGKITQAQADQMTANATQRVTDMVNGVKPAGGPGHPGDMGPGPDGPPPAAASTSTSTSSAA